MQCPGFLPDLLNQSSQNLHFNVCTPKSENSWLVGSGAGGGGQPIRRIFAIGIVLGMPGHMLAVLPSNGHLPRYDILLPHRIATGIRTGISEVCRVDFPAVRQRM